MIDVISESFSGKIMNCIRRLTIEFDLEFEEIATWLILPVAYACLKD